MKYFTDKISGKHYHCTNNFNWAAIDSCGSVFLYELKPIKRSNYWSGGSGSHDLCVVQRDTHHKEWETSIQKLTR